MKRFAHRGIRAARFAGRIAPFWLRQPLYRWTPGGFGYYRKLRRYADPGYVHERDKHPVRAKHHDSEGLLPPDAEGFQRVLLAFVEVNIGLMVFNLIPVVTSHVNV